MIFLGVYTLVLPGLILGGCIPFAANWNPSIPGAKCVDWTKLYRWGILPNVFTDLGILVLPLPIVWNLQTTFRMKLGLTVTFAVGVL